MTKMIQLTGGAPGDTFTVTFDDNDLPTAVEGPGAAPHFQEMLQNEEARKVCDYNWWFNGFTHRYTIEDISDQQEAAKFEIAKLDDDKHLVFGWAYVTHDEEGNVLVDKSGEFIDDPEELERAAYDFVIKSRAAGDMHSRTGDDPVQVGTMVESMVLTPEKAKLMGIPPGTTKTGWFVGFKIEDEDVWKAVKSGERPAFSIHGKAKKEPFNGT